MGSMATMNTMSRFDSHNLDEDSFGPVGGSSVLRTFDAFPKTKASYTQRSAGGGYMTVMVIVLSGLLIISEFSTWWTGAERQSFSVEKGVAHTMQINLDAVVAMKCDDMNVNVQDASGDRIMADAKLTRDATSWKYWSDPKRMQKMQVNRDKKIREEQIEEDRHVGHVLGEIRSTAKKFPKTPKTPRGHQQDACRVFGSLEINRVQGDFHITARGHGYMDFGHEHLDHTAFNFSHIINELSFGPLYPSLLNPLDNTASVSEEHFIRYQYYLSIVPTIYTRSRNPRLPPLSNKPHEQEALRHFHRGQTVVTNQYAVTSQKGVVSENTGVPGGGVPGVFFKFDIEPILLTVTQTSGGLLAFLMRIVNVVSGILVAGGWVFQLVSWAEDNFLARRRRRQGYEKGMIHGGHDEE